MKASASAVLGLVAIPPDPTAKPYAGRPDQADRGLGGDRVPVAVTKREIRFGLVLLALAVSVGLAAAWPARPMSQVGSAPDGP
jgi:hypothetical protein